MSKYIIKPLCCSLSDWVNVIIVSRVDLAVVAQRQESLLEFLLAHPLLDKVPDVALVDELVRLWHLFHALKNELLAVTGMRVEACIPTCNAANCRSAHTIRASDPCSCSCGLLAHQGAVREDTFLADAVSYEYL